MATHLSLVGIENSIDRLMLPAFHSRAFPIAGRRQQYQIIIDSIEHLYDCSAIDVLDYDQLSDRAQQAYIHGGLV